MKSLSILKGKKILLTGHTGFKGSWMTVVLNTLGCEVYGYSLEPPTTPSLYDIAGLEKIINSKIGDIQDYDELQSYISKVEPDVVIHMAAQPIVIEGYKNPRETYSINVMGTVNVLEAVRNCKSVKAVLNVTTDKVYLNSESGTYYKESDRLDGYDPYSNSKSCSELVTHCYMRSFFETMPPIATARAGNVIGGGDFANNRIIPDCVKSAIKKETIRVRNPNSIRPYQHVLEPIFAYLLIICKELSKTPISTSYNIGPDKENCIDTKTLVTIFCKKWGENLKWESVKKDGPHEANYLHLDNTLIKEELGFKPRWDVEKAIEKTIEWTKHWSDKKDILSVMEKQVKEYLNAPVETQ